MPILTTLSKPINKKHDIKTTDPIYKKVKEIVDKLIIEQSEIMTEDKREYLEMEIRKLVDKDNDVDRKKLFDQVKQRLFGYGILEDYIINEDISDIDFTRYNYGTYKINGKKKKLPVTFESEDEFQEFCEFIIRRNGGTIDENNSHWRVADENNRLRINVTIPPRNRVSCSLIIRKHRQNPYDLNDLVKLGMLNDIQRNKLLDYIDKDKSILICGKGASGKTTLMRALLMQVDILKSVLVCEKDTELYMDRHPNFISQRIKKAEDGGREVTLKHLINDGLTMSLSAYCIGELIGDETWSFISAGYTDHTIYGTLHARSPRDAIDRLLSMIDMQKISMREDTVKSIITKSIDLVIYMKDFKINSMQSMDHIVKKGLKVV